MDTSIFKVLFTDKDWSLIAYKEGSHSLFLQHKCPTYKGPSILDDHPFAETGWSGIISRLVNHPNPCQYCNSSPPKVLVTLGLLGEE